jgi:hypothetical protein
LVAAALVVSMLGACTLPAEQVAKPYALSGVDNYCYPFHAKVEEYGYLNIGKGYVGQDDQGRVFISFFKRGASAATEMGLHDEEDLQIERWQIEGDCGFLILESKPQGSAMRLSSLIPMDFKPTDFWLEDDMPNMVLINSMDNLALEPNGTEWRREFHSENHDVVLIFGEGRSWSERPEDTFLLVEEQEDGSFFVNGVRVQLPYWNVHEGWTKESTEIGPEDEPEMVDPRQPAKPQ